MSDLVSEIKRHCIMSGQMSNRKPRRKCKRPLSRRLQPDLSFPSCSNIWSHKSGNKAFEIRYIATEVQYFFVTCSQLLFDIWFPAEPKITPRPRFWTCAWCDDDRAPKLPLTGMWRNRVVSCFLIRSPLPPAAADNIFVVPDCVGWKLVEAFRLRRRAAGLPKAPLLARLAMYAGHSGFLKDTIFIFRRAFRVLKDYGALYTLQNPNSSLFCIFGRHATHDMYVFWSSQLGLTWVHDLRGKTKDDGQRDDW
jgi:hypothetical protein